MWHIGLPQLELMELRRLREKNVSERLREDAQVLSAIDADLTTTLDWQPGDRLFGQFDVERIALGGMAVVYICNWVPHHMRVALKVPKLALAAVWNEPEGATDVIRQELKAWSRITPHDNVVQFIDARHLVFLHSINSLYDRDVRAYSFPALVIEYGGDRSLRDVIRQRGALNARITLALLRQVARGMDHAHHCGIRAHLDLKPDNILISAHRVAKITDFGLAHVAGIIKIQSCAAGTASEFCTLTSPRFGWAGTPLYMAPEQWHGLSHCDVRTDIYAFGLLAAELLLGCHPFEQVGVRDLHGLRAMHSDAGRTLGRLNQWPGIRRIVERCVARQPKDRFLSWGDVLEALKARIDRRAPRTPEEQLQADEQQLRAAIWFRDETALTRATQQVGPAARRRWLYHHARIELLLVQQHNMHAIGTTLLAFLRGRLRPREMPLGSRREMWRAVEGLGYGVVFLVGIVACVWGLVALKLDMACLSLLGIPVGGMLAIKILGKVARSPTERCPNCGKRVRPVLNAPLASWLQREAMLGVRYMNDTAICRGCGYHRASVGPGCETGIEYRWHKYKFMGAHCKRAESLLGRRVAPRISFGKRVVCRNAPQTIQVQPRLGRREFFRPARYAAWAGFGACVPAYSIALLADTLKSNWLFAFMPLPMLASIAFSIIVLVKLRGGNELWRARVGPLWNVFSVFWLAVFSFALWLSTTV